MKKSLNKGDFYLNKDAIEFINVKKKFKNNREEVIKGISVCIEKGSFVTILGGSGSGKTTLLKMVNKIFKPTSGEMLFFGENIKNIDTVKHKRKIGYVIQQIGLFPHMTVKENISTVPKILKWDSKKIEERVDYLLDLVNLNPNQFKNRYPSQLSGGQQQRVGLARAMAADPSVMLMDEPFGAIDAITRTKLQDEMIEIQKKLNKTILFVTHDINEAFKLGDKVLIINDGKLEQFDTPVNIIFKPANEYVSSLISRNLTFQKLNKVVAKDVLIPLKDEDFKQERFINEDEKLYNILDIFINEELDFITVVDDDKIKLGKITWNELRIKPNELSKLE